MKNLPKSPFHPGEMLLEEFLKPGGLPKWRSRSALPGRARLNELIKGRRGVTADGAPDLATAAKTSPKLWMSLQATYELTQALQRRKVA